MSALRPISNLDDKGLFCQGSYTLAEVTLF
jgi:hypothetical protein